MLRRKCFSKDMIYTCLVLNLHEFTQANGLQYFFYFSWLYNALLLSRFKSFELTVEKFINIINLFLFFLNWRDHHPSVYHTCKKLPLLEKNFNWHCWMYLATDAPQLLLLRCKNFKLNHTRLLPNIVSCRKKESVVTRLESKHNFSRWYSHHVWF